MSSLADKFLELFTPIEVVPALEWARLRNRRKETKKEILQLLTEGQQLRSLPRSIRLSQYMLIIKNDRVVGCGKLSLVALFAVISHVAISPQYRGKGYGKILVEKLLTNAEKRGKLYTVMTVRASNEPMKRLAYSLGFLETAVVQDETIKVFATTANGSILCLI